MWQLDGQWWMITCHESALGGSAPSCGSVAWPEKVMVSLTFQVSVERGESTNAVGGAAPAVIVMGALMVGGAALIRHLEAGRVGASRPRR